MKTKIKVLTGKVVFELAIVSLGILLALAVNSWFENHQQREQAHNLLKKIEYEISNNFIYLKEVNAAFIETIKRNDGYIADLKSGGKIDINHSVNILDVDFAVWKFTQHRKELDQLPVEILITISESYRALEKAEELTHVLAFSKFGEIVNNIDGNDVFLYVPWLTSLITVK